MKLSLGILGGMGPQATLDLQRKIMDLTKAERDFEHIRVYVDNHPQIPDRIGAVLRNTLSPAPAMQESLDKLISIGAGVIVMPCVSAHYFLPKLNISPQVIFLNMLQITAQICATRYAGLIAGVLCSEATAQSGILSPYLENCSVPHIYAQAEDQRLLGRLILEVKAKADLHVLSDSLRLVAEEMCSRGADYFVLACTELPIIVQCEPLPYPCLDATVELAKAAIMNCGYELQNAN